MRSHKKSIVISLIVLSVAMVSAMAALRGQTQTQSTSTSRNSQAYKDEPTPIQEGVMTEKQKKHSKHFAGYGASTRGKKLKDFAAGTGDVEITQTVGAVILPQSFKLNDYLQDLVCKADAVIVGVVKSKSSQIIEEGTFVFTDYDVIVEEVLKNNFASPIQLNTPITITRTGGAVKLNGHTIVATDHRQEPLDRAGRYLFFLRFIPTTGAYMSFASSVSEDTFNLDGNKIAQASPKALPFGPRRAFDVAPFMAQIHTSLNTVCSK